MQKHKNRPFVIAMLILLVLLIGGLAGMGLWMRKEMGSFDLERILARLTGQVNSTLDKETEISSIEVSLPLPVEETATGESDEAIESTVEISTPTEEAQSTVVRPVETQAVSEDADASSSETTEASESSVADAETGNAETTETATDATAELPDTGIMDELGLPIILGLGASLIVVIMLLKRLKSAV